MTIFRIADHLYIIAFMIIAVGAVTAELVYVVHSMLTKRRRK